MRNNHWPGTRVHLWKIKMINNLKYLLGVCSDYDEENGDELMLTASSNEASSWEDDEGEEEEILL
jgi:hypothetical protein